LREIFDEILNSLPNEEAPAQRLAFEQYRRDILKKAKIEANKIG
jgi:hypothetical protein